MVKLTDRPDMTLDVYRGRKTTTQQQHGEAQLRCHDLTATFCTITEPLLPLDCLSATKVNHRNSILVHFSVHLYGQTQPRVGDVRLLWLPRLEGCLLSKHRPEVAAKVNHRNASVGATFIFYEVNCFSFYLHHPVMITNPLFPNDFILFTNISYK